jgi:hypothetical protein
MIFNRNAVVPFRFEKSTNTGATASHNIERLGSAYDPRNHTKAEHEIARTERLVQVSSWTIRVVRGSCFTQVVTVASFIYQPGRCQGVPAIVMTMNNRMRKLPGVDKE